MELLQAKLNVTHKKRSNLFNWRGQFTPDFAAYLIKNFSKIGDLVIDPFSGSGTVLQEAVLEDRCAQGFEINPAAYAMSQFFTFANEDLENRWEQLYQFEAKLTPFLKTLTTEKVFTEDPDYRTSYQNLLNIGSKIIPTLDKKELILWLNMLFLSESDKNVPLKQSIQKSYIYIKNALVKLPYTTHHIHAHWQDARTVGNYCAEQADLILTSPPYINVFNYHQNYRALVELLEVDILRVANSEFGSNRKNRGNRFKTVVQYCVDMEQAIKSFWQALKPNGVLILVLGRQSNVRSTPFYNGQIVLDIVQATQGFTAMHNLERQFTNKFGNNIKEDILIFHKATEINQEVHAPKIAYKHLEISLLNADTSIQADLKAAMQAVETIDASPLFKPNQPFKYG